MNTPEATKASPELKAALEKLTARVSRQGELASAINEHLDRLTPNHPRDKEQSKEESGDNGAISDLRLQSQRLSDHNETLAHILDRLTNII